MQRFRVKELAQARGITSEDLAIKSGVRISTVRNIWQNRVKDPSLSTVAALARALEVQIEDLYAPVSESDYESFTERDGSKGVLPENRRGKARTPALGVL